MVVLRCAPKPLIVVALALFSIGLTGCFRVSTDVAVLRDSVLNSGAGRWDEEFEIGVGAVTLSLARAGLSFVDLEPEARGALQAVQGAEVAVYRLRDGHKPLSYTAMLSDADKAMAKRGWDRVVGVIHQHELVAVYVPKDTRSTRNVRACLLTLNGHELVVASARSNLEPLIEIARNRMDWPKRNTAVAGGDFPPHRRTDPGQVPW
jgi:hypothetical protein